MCQREFSLKHLPDDPLFQLDWIMEQWEKNSMVKITQSYCPAFNKRTTSKIINIKGSGSNELLEQSAKEAAMEEERRKEEEGSKIQACVKSHLVKNLSDLLEEDEVVIIKKFGVGEQRDKHRVINLDKKINFFKCTEVFKTAGFTGQKTDMMKVGLGFIP